MLAQHTGISASAVRRIWRAHGLQPHLYRQFKLSNDPRFAEKLRDVVGLYVDPPAHAIVLSVDEKSQIQALDRTQPGLPLKKGRLGTMTHDYKRNGTTTLFAALNVLDDRKITRLNSSHANISYAVFCLKKKKITHIYCSDENILALNRRYSVHYYYMTLIPLAY